MSAAVVIDALGICGAVIGFLGTIRPGLQGRLPVRVVTGLVCLALLMVISLQRVEDARIGRLVDRTLATLESREQTSDEIHAALGDVTLVDVGRALKRARDRHIVDERVVELLHPEGDLVGARMYFRVR